MEEHFDLVVGSDIIYRDDASSNHHPVLQAAYSILKEGGKLIISGKVGDRLGEERILDFFNFTIE